MISLFKKIFKQVVVRVITAEARLVLKKYRPKIIAVTGSVGKTSTKDAIYTALAPHMRVRKSDKSFNSEFGVPLTILDRPNGWYNPGTWLVTMLHGLELILFSGEYPECLVLEVGADHPGDIKNIAFWLSPDVVVMTRIGKVAVHVEFFKSHEELVAEKASLIKALKPEGTLILSADDEVVRTLKTLRDGKPGAVMMFGIHNQEADIRAEDVGYAYTELEDVIVPVGMKAKVSVCTEQGMESKEIEVRGALGVQLVYPLLAAIAVAKSQKISLESAVTSLVEHIPSRGRMNILEARSGAYIIDDSYNASPDAMREALSVLTSVECSGRRIAVLGDMLELGKFSIEEHKKAGGIAAQSVDILVTVGVRARHIAEAAVGVGMPKELVISFDDSYKAAEYVLGIMTKGDIVLVKGSQSIRTERIVKALMAHPEMASQLLVRQETEWLAKK